MCWERAPEAGGASPETPGGSCVMGSWLQQSATGCRVRWVPAREGSANCSPRLPRRLGLLTRLGGGEDWRAGSLGCWDPPGCWAGGVGIWQGDHVFSVLLEASSARSFLGILMVCYFYDNYVLQVYRRPLFEAAIYETNATGLHFSSQGFEGG